VQEGGERETTDDEGVCKEEGEEGTVGSENDEVVKDRDRDTDLKSLSSVVNSVGKAPYIYQAWVNNLESLHRHIICGSPISHTRKKIR